MTRIAPPLAAGALLLAFVLQCLTGMVERSATFDEQVYVAAGYASLETGDFRLKRDAPPLVATLAGLALRALETRGGPLDLPLTDGSWTRSLGGDGGAEYTFAGAFFRAGRNDGFRMLQAARLPVVATGVLLGVFVFRWARRLFGDAGGLLALLVFAFDPNMIAHATVVSTDVPLAAFFLASHYWFHRLLSEPGYRSVLLLALSVALTLAAKFTGLLVVPSLGLVGAIYLLRPPTRAERARLLRLAPVVVTACAAATWLLLAVLYRRWNPLVPYVEGVGRLYANIQPDFEYYLLGEFRNGTWPHYYLVAMLVKTPEATLVLVLLALLPWGRRPYPWREILVLLVPVALVHLVCSQDRAQLGVRRVLLAYPFLFVLIGRLADAWRRPEPGRLGYPPGRAAALAGLAALVVAGAWRIHPYQLSYFNLLCGGPAGGHACLDDSNIDWGQDLPGLATYLAEHGIDQVRLFSYAIEPPETYEIRSTPVTEHAELARPGPHVYAMGVHNLVRLKLWARISGDDRLDWLSRHQPSGRVGYSIYVYDFRGGGPPDAPAR